MPMRPAWPAAALTLVAALSLWDWTLDPKPTPLWVAVLLPAIWGYVELVARGDSSVSAEMLGLHRRILTVIGSFLAVKLALAIAWDLHVLPVALVPAARRSVGLVFGTLMLIWGNHLPKITSPWTLDEEPFNWQRVHRAIGWLATLAGLAVAVGWLALPLGQADRLQDGAVIACIVLGIAVKFTSVAAHARRRTIACWLLAAATLASPI